MRLGGQFRPPPRRQDPQLRHQRLPVSERGAVLRQGDRDLLVPDDRQGGHGPQAGKRLRILDSVVTTWKEWRQAHEKTTVLLPPYPLRAYRGNPYARYFATDRIIFPIGDARRHPHFKRFKPKSVVTIVFAKDKARCYPHASWKGTLNDQGLVLRRKGRAVRVTDKEGKTVPAMQALWFAWCAFYPDGTVYGVPAAPKKKAAAKGS